MSSSGNGNINNNNTDTNILTSDSDNQLNMNHTRSIRFDDTDMSSYADSTMLRGTNSRGRSRNGLSSGGGDGTGLGTIGNGNWGNRGEGPSFSKKLRPDRSSGQFLDSTENQTGLRQHRRDYDNGDNYEKIDKPTGQLILDNASQVFDEVANRAAGKTSKKSFLNHVDEDAYEIKRSENKSYRASKYPDSFKCSGQFCKLHVTDVGPLTHNQNPIEHL
jgi:hypothetical protein